MFEAAEVKADSILSFIHQLIPIKFKERRIRARDEITEQISKIFSILAKHSYWLYTFSSALPKTTCAKALQKALRKPAMAEKTR